MKNILMEIPKCKIHGEQMILRAARTKEQSFCGTWYDCPVCGCGCSILLPSQELNIFLAKFKG